MIKAGDKVRTVKGSRKSGPKRNLTVIETGRNWSGFEAALCEDENGKRHLYLDKNLVPEDALPIGTYDFESELVLTEEDVIAEGLLWENDLTGWLAGKAMATNRIVVAEIDWDKLYQARRRKMRTWSYGFFRSRRRAA